MTGKTRNAGQVCVSPTRFFVQEAIYREFTAAFAEMARAVKVGDGLDPSNQMGPLANHRRIEAMEMFVADARAKGARVLSGVVVERQRDLADALGQVAVADERHRTLEVDRLVVADVGLGGRREQRLGQLV